MALQEAGSVPAGPKDVGRPGPAEVAELLLVAVAVLQGLALALWLGAFPRSALELCGLASGATLFARWAGALHAALALAYVADFVGLRRIAILLATKGATALLLLLVWMAEGLPLVALAILALDAATALTGALLRAPAERSRRARTRLRLVSRVPVEAWSSGGR